MRLVLRSWGLMNKKEKYIQEAKNDCRLCGMTKETYHHIFHECLETKQMVLGWQEAARTGGKKIDFKEEGWGMAQRDLGGDQATRVA